MYRSARLCNVGDVPGLSLVRVMRYWRKRAVGAAITACCGSVCSADQSLQVSSGSWTLPLRTATITFVPVGLSAFQRSEPHLLMILASSTSEITVPLAL